MVEPELRLQFTFWKQVNLDTNKIGLTFKQAQTLVFLIHSPGVTMTAIAKEIGLTAAAITGLIDRLTEKKLVLRKYDPTNRRVVLVEISDKGKSKANQFITILKRRMPWERNAGKQI
jgi:DNA-binding MarR family transcriptional regulator